MTLRHEACPNSPDVDQQKASVASSPEPEVEPVNPLAVKAAGRPRRPGRQQFSLLIVRGDGTRVIRFNFPRPAALAAFAGVAVAVTTFGALLGDWVQLRQLTVEARTFKAQIAEQHATIDSFNRRVVELRTEMTSWRDLHARIWEPYGAAPHAGGGARAIGGGGPSAGRGDRPPSPPGQSA